jgi:hypothetical protein
MPQVSKISALVSNFEIISSIFNADRISKSTSGNYNYISRPINKLLNCVIINLYSSGTLTILTKGF